MSKSRRYRMDDNTIADTDRATESWEAASDWDGSNHVDRSSGSQWRDDTLHRSAKGRYWLEHRSRIDHERDSAEWLTPADAARWLLANDEELPEDLQQFDAEIHE